MGSSPNSKKDADSSSGGEKSGLNNLRRILMENQCSNKNSNQSISKNISKRQQSSNNESYPSNYNVPNISEKDI